MSMSTCKISYFIPFQFNVHFISFSIHLMVSESPTPDRVTGQTYLFQRLPPLTSSIFSYIWLAWYLVEYLNGIFGYLKGIFDSNWSSIWFLQVTSVLVLEGINDNNYYSCRRSRFPEALRRSAPPAEQSSLLNASFTRRLSNLLSRQYRGI